MTFGGHVKCRRLLRPNYSNNKTLIFFLKINLCLCIIKTHKLLSSSSSFLGIQLTHPMHELMPTEFRVINQAAFKTPTV